MSAEQLSKQSFSDIRAAGPDERPFHDMEKRIAKDSPGAEARREEMAKWAEATGTLVEKSHYESVAHEQSTVRNQYSAEGAKYLLRSVNREIAAVGVYSGREGFKAGKNGSVIKRWAGEKETYRSPAHIKEPVPEQ